MKMENMRVKSYKCLDLICLSLISIVVSTDIFSSYG